MASISIAKEAANVIHTVAISSKKENKQVWSTAIELLIELDEKAYKKQMDELNLVTTSYIASFPVRYARTGPDDWELIKNHFFEYFHKALHEGRIKLERVNSHTEIDYLSAMSSLLLAVTQGAATDKSKWNEISEKIISEFESAMKEPRLRECYSLQAVFALIFHIMTDRYPMFGGAGMWGDDDKKKVASDLVSFVKGIFRDSEDEAKLKACRLLKEAKNDILVLRYAPKIAIIRNGWPKQFAYPEIEKKLCGET